MKIDALPPMAIDSSRLADLFLELCSQLHAERARRMALECALEEAGVLPSDWAEHWPGSSTHEQRCQASLDHALERIMQIMSESDDPRTPLRGEAAAFRTP